MIKFMRTLAVLLAAFLLPALALAQSPPAPGVVRATLPNGLRVVIVRNTLAPVVTTEINYLVGSNEAPAGFPGTAHALEHMMFRGSPGLTRSQLAQIAAAMGGDYDADTTQTVTQFFFTAPASDLDVALHIESIRMRGLDLTPSGWAKERGAIEQEVSMDNSNPIYKFETQVEAALFKGTPYAHDALGTRPSFNKTTAGLLRTFYSTWYAPNNAILVIAGDVDPAAALAEVRKLFGTIPAKPLPARPAVRLEPVQPRTLSLPTDLPVSLVAVSYRMPGLQARDYAAAEILADVLGSQRGSLYALVPEGKVLETGFAYEPEPQVGEGIAYAAVPKGANTKMALGEVQAVLRTIVKDGVPADLVEAAKRNEIASLEFNKNSISGLANAWSSALAFQGLDSPDAMKAAFQGVTVADVDRVARETLDPAHAINAILQPQASGKAIASKGFGGAESFASAPGKTVKLPAWAEKALSRVEVPRSSIHPVVTTLPNGLKLVVQPESVSDTVSVFGAVHTTPSLQQPKGQDGVAAVLGGLYMYGTRDLDRLSFLKALDDINVTSDSFGSRFSIAVPAQHFARAIQLLADDELHPALPAQAFKVVQMQTARTLAGQLQSPDYRFQRAIMKALVPAHDPSLRQATPQSVMGLTLADVRAYHDEIFRPDLTTIVIVGNVTPAEAEHVVTKYFGRWKAAGPKPDIDLARIPLNRPSQAVVPDPSAVQDTVRMVQNLGINLHDPEHYALTLGSQVLSGGVFASRLYHDLRVKAGLVYYVGGVPEWNTTRSMFVLYFGCDPDKVSQARALALRDLRQMQTQPVTPAELTRAKAELMRSIPLGESSINAIGARALYYAEHDLPPDTATIAARHYLAITAPEIQAAFKRYLHPNHFATVVKGPQPK